jgi:predicted transcriptional regulator
LETSFLVSSQRMQSQQQLNRRSRMETYCDIIRAIGGGAEKPTHIMYRANLSWTVMQAYIRALEGQGLVQAQDIEGKRLYQLTEKGFGLLKQYISIKEDLRLSTDET